MIKLKIRKYVKVNFILKQPLEIIEEVIDFDGDYKDKFIIQKGAGSTLMWIPMLRVDEWEPIEKIIDEN